MVFDRSSGKLRPIGSHPILSSAHLDWRGVLLEQHRFSSLGPNDVIWVNNVIVYQLNHAITLESRQGSSSISRRILPGQVSILPSQVGVVHHCAEPLEIFYISLDPSFMRTVYYELSDPNEFKLMLQYGIEDRFIEGVCLALKREVEQGGPSGRLYSESLATSLAVHLALKHSKRQGKSSAEVKEGLSPRAVRQAMEFINARLSEDFSLKDIAAAAGLSPFHFARLFKRSVGISPYQFVINQRIEAAKQLMLRGELTLMEIALEVGFYDQSHFSQHFKRLNGITPKQFTSQIRN